MRCPECGTPMNKHAEKPLKTRPTPESSQLDPALDGVISAIHCCPGCGKVEAEPLAES